MSKISLIHHSLALQKLEVEDSFHWAHQVQGLCQFDRCVCAPSHVDRNSSVIFHLVNLLGEWHFCQHFSETEEPRVKCRNKILMCVTNCYKFAGCPQHSSFLIGPFQQADWRAWELVNRGCLCSKFSISKAHCVAMLKPADIHQDEEIPWLSSQFWGICMV